MKLKLIPAAHELISNMRALFQINNATRSDSGEEPLRAALFSTEQMEHFGKALAANHTLSSKAAKDHLLRRLADNENHLQDVRRLLADSIKKKYHITPAGEWLIDNFYLIEEHIRIAKTHFPKNYSEDLPQLLDVDAAGVTRIYDIVLKIVSHSDGRIDIESLNNFISAYQTVTHLQLGELWAIPIMLRLALIENIRRVAAHIAIDKVDRNLADYWAGQMMETAEKNPKNLILVIADMARSNPPMVSAFVSELTRQLRGKGPDLALVLNWIEQQLAGSGLKGAEMVNAENQKLAANQVSMRNSIGSLRLLGATDWRNFVEKQSIVEQTLRLDNNGIYGLMDFATRDRYRHVVELIANKSSKNEREVARIAIDLTNERISGIAPDPRTGHVGYYLIDKGLGQTKKLANMHMSVVQKIWSLVKSFSFSVYVISVVLITCALTAFIVTRADAGIKNKWLFVFIAFLSLLCTSQLAIAVVNFISTILIKPNLLPRMDFSASIPAAARTLVIVPSLLTRVQDIEDLVEALEIRFLANRNDNLYFGLLTDFTDAMFETLPEDQGLLNTAKKGIEGLNAKYQRNQNDLFFLFHRPRKWNAKERVWMGYERKRGKLSDLNALLRGTGKEKFSLVTGDQQLFPQIKYVITLDADTQLPLGSAWKLAGTMAHPLNKAWYDEKKKRVTKGYGILQPRITVSLPDITGSRYTRMHGNEPGIDPYTRASSDVYQDLFAEGSFIGKGIYEVDIFQQVLEGRFSENRILSHDLLEGCYIRSGLLSDVQLFEKYPATYQADVTMRLRWLRGDWQIFSWFLPLVPSPGKRWNKNPLSGLSRWKIMDNIRRSLVPIALTLLLITGWVFMASSLFWTLAVSGIIVFPIFITSVWDTIRKPLDVTLKYHVINTIHSIAEISVKTLFTLICLPFEAFSNLMAILLTLWRMLVTKRKLLEWNHSANVQRIKPSGLSASYAAMWIQPALALAVIIVLGIYAAYNLLIAGPILLLWLIAPLVTWFASKPLEKKMTVLSEDQTIFLRKLARKTWSFFERFAVAGDNWLPPDNYQEQPVEQLAHRTSPTNIGLSLLAGLSARDFGYSSNGQFLERTKNTIGTLAKMERFKGHFYNWYDTESLQPLLPKYISTVDSGNLAGHLLVLRQGLLRVPHQPIIGKNLFEGLMDTLRLLMETLTEKEIVLMEPCRFAIEKACNDKIISCETITSNLETISKSYQLATEKITSDAGGETYRWIQLLNHQIDGLGYDFKMFTPWLLLSSAPAALTGLIPAPAYLTLTTLSESGEALQATVLAYKKDNLIAAETVWVEAFENALTHAVSMALDQIFSAGKLAEQCNILADMEWDFLYDKSSHLFTIGYNAQEHLADASYYDLLASEVRLCIFICIAQGKLPGESWFALGRLLTNVDGNSILLSWSGSMFEYLMPLLVMPTYENTLLDQTYKAAVEWQIKYGRKTGMPWGISESCYNMINANSSYQYRAFGAPGLGLKRGLEEDAVVAPYASALGLMVAPEKACDNLELLYKKGMQGKYGLYEAIDYTPSRLQPGQSSAIVYSYMAHHHGMSLLSLSYLLHDKPMQQLFELEPQFKATLLLLQERIPKATSFFAHTTDIADVNYAATGTETRIINTADTLIPEVQLLSNGRYHVMVTNAGAGYSRWKGIAVTRWREDVTCDNWGSFCYIRDLDNKTYWSNTKQPTLKKGEKYEAGFSQGRVDFNTVHNEIETHTEMVVSPEDDIEMRRILMTNRSSYRRSIEVTSYAEVVLAAAASDAIQPAFSNLFVQTEIFPLQHAIVCTRRPRSAGEKSPWLFHLMTIEGKSVQDISYETDRMEFIGRGNTTANPIVMNKPGPLSGSQGSVLDPIVAIRYTILLEPEETITIDIVTGITETKDSCQDLINRYQDNKPHKDRVFEMAWTHSQVVLRQINATEADAQLYGSLASSILFTNAALRADPSILINNYRQQSGLWGYSISGDLPIVLLKIEKQENMLLVKQLVQAHAYWRLKGLAIDLVIWNEEHYGYRQVFQNEIEALIPAEVKDRPGGIFVRASDQISNEDRILFQTVARICVSDAGGTLADHVKRKQIGRAAMPAFKASQLYKSSSVSVAMPKDLNFFNGLGGFTPDGKEYVITVDQTNKTPAPWVNVIANPQFGTVISESGSAYTWMENAHELRLTTWNNDPVCDRGGEAFYLRDEESGHFWSTSLLPAGGKTAYITRHGLGYSVFEHMEDGIYSAMTVYADMEAAVKFIVIKISNQSGRPRKLSATGYMEWVLGDSRQKTAMHIHTEIDPDSKILFAKNPYNTEFSHRVVFFDADYPGKTVTADRTEFIGRNSSLQNPAALLRQALSGKTGLALDPCAAIMVPFNVAVGEETEIVFRLGAGQDANDAIAVARQFRATAAAHEALEKVKKYWINITGALQVETPDTAVNLMANGWLTYQTLSSRLWGRSGFYQSGGAFGFRDQLQDVLSLLHCAPELARKQILLCASRQFQEGDAQHWWHPPVGRGVRTRISDDFLWLPLVTSLYILHTGDDALLGEPVNFIEGRQLNREEESYFDLPVTTGNAATVYEHCVRSIRHGFNYGIHGLPLIGTGDWNDGLDKVGFEGRGESVWLAFFFYEILNRFADTALLYNDAAFADECKKQAQRLQDNIEANAWDGQWYKRAWFDDGTPLGAVENEECKIDSIAQSWAVLSGAGSATRIKTAMESAYTKLVQKEAGIIKLLDPAFDKSNLNPGYIKGYVPGIRENGGQYTHAAVWLIMAFAKLGDNQRVWELLKMINPVNHGKTPGAISIYKVEPYVIAADIYAGSQHAGRGGWTWYTGSAGWMYRLIAESFLGIRQQGNKLTVLPCMPEEWTSFKVHYRYKNTFYHILVLQEETAVVMTVTVDNIYQPDLAVTLTDDGVKHDVEIIMAKRNPVVPAGRKTLLLPDVQ
jgi:cyclic beta-1,2-glucan synthetase